MTGRWLKWFLYACLAVALGATFTGQYALSTAVLALGISIANTVAIRTLEDRNDR